MPVTDTHTRLEAAGLPPARRRAERAREAAAGPDDSGCQPRPRQVEPYRARLSLDTVSQPYVSAGVSRFGPSVGGGLAFLWSDMLGNHNLYAEIAADTYGVGILRHRQEHRRHPHVLEHDAPLELGRLGGSDSVHRRRLCEPAPAW